MQNVGLDLDALGRSLPERYRSVPGNRYNVLTVDPFTSGCQSQLPQSGETALPPGFLQIKPSGSFTEALKALITAHEEQGRSFEILFLNRPDKCWQLLATDTDEHDFGQGEKPAIIVHFKSAAKAFIPSAFLRDSGHFKKFQSGVGKFSSITDFELRVPQMEALTKMTRVLNNAGGGSRFLIVLPTGLGKSAVIALAPFCLGASRVLCIIRWTSLSSTCKAACK